MVTLVGSLTAANVFPKLNAASGELQSFLTKNTSQLTAMSADLTQAGSFLTSLQTANTAAQGAIDSATALGAATSATMAGLTAALGAAGIHVYAGATTPTELGEPMKTNLGGTGAQAVWAVILVADNSAAWSALQLLVKTS